MHNFNLKHFSQNLTRLKCGDNLYVAFSGGMDSLVLLYAVAQLQQFKVTAVHVNHNLSANAAKWGEHCQEICAQLKVPLVLREVNAKPQPGCDHSPEELARNLRYKVLAKLLPKDACLLTAHHQDDQAETLLLQLLRGAGPAGLAAIPEQKPFAKGWLVRPLLVYSREALQVYAKQQNLEWISDESNFDSRFKRNFLRKEIMPLLKKHWPSLQQTIARSAAHCATAQQLLEQLAAEDYVRVRSNEANALLLDELLLLNVERQQNLLRFWLKRLGLAIPTTAELDELQKALHCRRDAMPKVTWGEVTLRRYRNKLYVLINLENPQSDAGNLVIHWDITKELKLPGDLGVLEPQQLTLELRERIAGRKVTVSFRHGGERLLLAKRGGHHSLKKLFQEWGIPPWQRNRVPLIYADDELVGVLLETRN